MTDDINTTDFDIFALPPVLEDEKAIAFKCEVDELRGRLHTMVQTAPTADDRTLLEKEEWSREWKLLIVSNWFSLLNDSNQTNNLARSAPNRTPSPPAFRSHNIPRSTSS
jgi:hypothetical protein